MPARMSQHLRQTLRDAGGASPDMLVRLRVLAAVSEPRAFVLAAEPSAAWATARGCSGDLAGDIDLASVFDLPLSAAGLLAGRRLRCGERVGLVLSAEGAGAGDLLDQALAQAAAAMGARIRRRWSADAAGRAVRGALLVRAPRGR